MSAVATRAVSVDARDLAESVAAVAPTAAGRTSVSILNTIRLAAKDGAMRLEACNGEAWVSRTIQADGECDVCLRAATLLAASKAIQGNGAEIVPDDKDNATLASGRAKFRLPGLEARDFPAFPEWGGDEEPVTLNRAEFASLLRGPLMAVSNDQYRAILTGVSFDVVDGVLFAAAYDNYRLHVSSTPNAGGVVSGVLPAPFLKAIEAMGAAEFDLRRLSPEGRWMARSAGAEAVHAPLFGAFPDWRRHTPSDAPLRAVMAREDFLSSIRRVCGTVAPQANRVRVRLDEGFAHVSAQDAERGDAEDFVSCDVSEPLEFAANHKYLADAASFLSGDGLYIFSQGSGRPLLFRGTGSDMVLVMPMALA